MTSKVFLAFLFLAVSTSAWSTVPYYTPQKIAQRVAAGERFHPQEASRGEQFFLDLGQAGKNVGCSAGLWAMSNGSPGKVFHEKVLGAGLVDWELLPNRPPEVRHGMFSDEVPQKITGLMSITRGRGDRNPWELIPDVLGMTVVLDVGGKLVALSMTNSQGAFGKKHLDFSRLAGFSAKAGLAGRWVAQPLGDLAKNQAGKIVGMAGEGLFIARHPGAGFFVLVPATMNGGLVRQTPFLGHKEIGFGSGQPFLLDEESKPRRAFKYGIRLVTDRGMGQSILNERTGFSNELAAIGRGLTSGRHLSKDFTYWNERGDIEFEVYVQLEDLGNYYNTPIEDPRFAWKSEKIPVARMTLRRQKPINENPIDRNIVDVNLQNDILSFARTMNANPGFSLHLPVGDLGVGRAMGPILGAVLRPAGRDPRDVAGSYWTSQGLRSAIGVAAGGDLDERAAQSQLQRLEDLNRRYQGRLE